MKKLGECDKKLGLLLKSVGEVEDKKAICDEKMVDLQSLLVESKQNQNDSGKASTHIWAYEKHDINISAPDSLISTRTTNLFYLSRYREYL